MSEARTAILNRVRQGIGGTDAAPRRQQAERRAATFQPGPLPQLRGEWLARFRAKAEALSSTTETIGGMAEAPQAVARYLAAQRLATTAVIAPQLAGLEWEAAGVQVSARAAVDADRVGITSCFCAIAETGTLMLLSDPQSPASISLLPETHVALVPVHRLVATMEEAFALLQQEKGSLPRAVNFVSGPSRTGDIEQTIVLGAHGPCRVHLILIEA